MRLGYAVIFTAFAVLALGLTPTAVADDGFSSVSSTSTSSDTSSTDEGSLVGPDPPTQGCRPTCR